LLAALTGRIYHDAPQQNAVPLADSNTRMAGFEDFQRDIAKVMEGALRPHMASAIERARSERMKFDFETLFVSSAPAPELPPDQRFGVDAFQVFMEISDAYDRLLDIQTYVRRYPFRGTRITRERYLRFHIEAYYHEVYILRERLNTFAKRIVRAYKRTGHPAADSTEDRLLTLVSALDAVVAVRGRHVHDLRFDETRLRNLAGIEMIERHSDDQMWTTFLKEGYAKVRAYWVKWVGEMNRGVRALLDQYFAILHELMFPSGTYGPPRRVG
jgi:hypothetical protein